MIDSAAAVVEELLLVVLFCGMDEMVARELLDETKPLLLPPPEARSFGRPGTSLAFSVERNDCCEVLQLD